MRIYQSLLRSTKNCITAIRQYRTGDVFFIFFMMANSLKVGYLLSIFYHTQKPQQQIIFHTLASAALAFPIWFFCLRRLVFFISFYIIQTVFLFANTVYYEYFQAYLHIATVSQLFGEGLAVVGGLGHFVKLSHAIVLADVPFMALAIVLRKQTIVFNRRWLRYGFIGCFGAITILGGLEYLNRTKSESIANIMISKHGGKFGENVHESTIVKRYGLIANIIIEALPQRNEERDIAKLAPSHRIVHSTVLSNKHPDILVLQLESCDASMIGLSIQGKQVMPYLTSLAHSSLYFPYTLSYHGAGGSSDAEFAILNSIPPLRTFPSLKLHYYTYPNSIIALLKAAGYSSFGFHGNLGDFFNRNNAYLKMGFNDFIGLEKTTLHNIGWGSLDYDFFNYLTGYLSRITSPWFAYAITLSSHQPYLIYKYIGIKSKFSSMSDSPTHDYLESMAYLDSVLSIFLPRIRAQHPHMLLVIFGDHPPIELPKGNPDFSPSVFQTQQGKAMFVPLIINGERVPQGQRNDVASFLDLGPTLLDLSGTTYSYATNGSSLCGDEAINQTIPFNEGFFNRKDLFAIIAQNRK